MRILKVLIIFFLILSFLSLMKVETQAQFEACDFLPCDQTDEDDQSDSESGTVNTSIENLFQFATSLVFIGIIIYGVFTIIRGALSIIRSEGNADKYQEGMKTVQRVWIGVGLIIVGLIGLIVVTAFFNSSDAFNEVGNIEEPEGVDIPIIN